MSVFSTTINFFEPHHGQNEGDSVHSSVERALRRHDTINLPSELAPIVRSARTTPTKVREITTEDVQDWKDLSRSLGILKVHQADDGKLVDWTTVKSITVRKDRLLQIGFKSSHTDTDYSYLPIDSRRTRREVVYTPLAHTTQP
ncbi:hypothetical protein SNE40_012043 [Patella caerulea]|uniref:Uncharacterized protein n=1 Tax=Patella caerulea TaxID=87958 RepID=A0AAN8PV74_PATCE